MIKGCLVTGSNGQLGQALTKEVEGVFVDIETADISNYESLLKIDWSEIDIIINAAAYTAVDQSETLEGRKTAWRVNVEGVRNLVKIAREKELLMVHISSDYVFDGETTSHSEEEQFSPLGVYGATKAAGDRLVETLEKYYILRTSWVVGKGKNFVQTMVSLANKGVSPTVVNDQFGRLTFADELARGIAHLIDQKSEFGTYNLTNSGDIASWAEIAERVYQIVGSEGRVTPVSTEAYYQGKENIASRPRYSTLSLDKIVATGFTPKDWSVELKNYLTTNNR